MCAIVDNNVRHEVFGDSPSPAGKHFLNWLEQRGGTLVIGGKLLRDELGQYDHFRKWFLQAALSGSVKRVADDTVDAASARLTERGLCRSDDPHILALAQVSGARLLFTNDRALQNDFTDRRILTNPRGRIYTTVEHSDIRPTHRSLLNRADLCAI